MSVDYHLILEDRNQSEELRIPKWDPAYHLTLEDRNPLNRFPRWTRTLLICSGYDPHRGDAALFDSVDPVVIYQADHGEDLTRMLESHPRYTTRKLCPRLGFADQSIHDLDNRSLTTRDYFTLAILKNKLAIRAAERVGRPFGPVR